MKGSLGYITRSLFWGFMMLHFMNFNNKFHDISIMNSKRVIFFEEFTKRRGTVIINYLQGSFL